MRNRTKPYDQDFRNRAVQLVEQGMSCYAVAKLLGCYRTSVSTWVDRYKELDQAIVAAAGKITASAVIAWFQHCSLKVN